METINFENDIVVMYVKANSFPEGIKAAHEKLHSIIPFSTSRKYFGISRPEAPDGEIQYKAAAEVKENDEAKKFGLEELILKKGNYKCITLHDYLKDLEGIGRAFEEILSEPGYDEEGYCVEWYINDRDVKCLVRQEKL